MKEKLIKVKERKIKEKRGENLTRSIRIGSGLFRKRDHVKQFGQN